MSLEDLVSERPPDVYKQRERLRHKRDAMRVRCGGGERHPDRDGHPDDLRPMKNTTGKLAAR